MQLTNTFTEVIINVIPSTLKNSGTTDIEIALSNEVPTQGDYSLAPNQYFNVEDSSLKLWVRAKVTEGTVTLLNFRHLEPLPPLFLGSQPHPSLILGFEATPNGLFNYNRFDDKMPIKTRNMAGLQKWEETDDYIIYLDKDAVMTTVESYVTGTYDLFKERKADIDGAMDLLKINNIEWTSEDDTKLILDINKAQLERIANTPTTMEEEDFIPQTFTTRAVPTTYEACFRVDKKSGEIYIGEGYENLIKQDFSQTCSKDWVKNEDGSYLINTDSTITENKRYVILSPTIPNIQRVTYSFEIQLENLENNSYMVGMRCSESVWGTKVISNSQNIINGYLKCVFIAETYNGTIGSYEWVDLNIYKGKPNNIQLKNIQVVKGGVVKPFVKSIMPSGKLAFVTGATSETHSFVMKGVKSNLELGASTYIYVCGSDFSYERATVGNNFEGDCLISKNFNNVSFVGSSGVTQGQVRLTTTKWNKDYFTQLLIYKANLTEAELKAENNKGFRLNPNLYLYPDNILGEIFTRVA